LDYYAAASIGGAHWQPYKEPSMKFRRLSIVTGAICAVVALSHLALADDAACQGIDAANGKSFSNGVSVNTKINKTGVDFAKDTPKIFSD
jgi:hypothetical protein